MKKEIYSCDVCKKETEVKKERIQVIFTTEQDEGRSTEPYLSDQNIDICKDCKKTVLEGKYIYASGAMGFNEYWFKRKIQIEYK